MLMETNGQTASEQHPIEKELPERPVVPLEEAYADLLPLTGEDGRAYLKQIHVHPSGFAVATDAHRLAALPVEGPDEPCEYPARDLHKSDAVRANGDGTSLVAVCTHKNDKSGPIEPVPSAENDQEFPDLSQVWPSTHPQLRVKVNADYLIDVVEALTEGEDTTAVELHFVAKQQASGDEESAVGINPEAPLKVVSDRGCGLVMPIRLED